MRRAWVVAVAVVLGIVGVVLSGDGGRPRPVVAATHVETVRVLEARLRPDPRYVVIGYIDDDQDGELVDVVVDETPSVVRLTVHVRFPVKDSRPGIGVGHLAYTTVTLAAPLGRRTLFDTAFGGQAVPVRQSMRAENVSQASVDPER